MIKRLLGLLQTDHFKASTSADQDMNCGEEGETKNSGIFFCACILATPFAPPVWPIPNRNDGVGEHRQSPSGPLS